MKRQIFLLITFFIAINLFSQEMTVERVEPPFWWTGMTNSNLQLLIYGTDIYETTPQIDYPGINIKDVVYVQNPNYIFIDLEISKETKPGNFNILFKFNGEVVQSYPYELKERKAGSASRKGFNRSDVIYLLMPDRFANGDPSNDDMPGMLEKANRQNPDGRHGGDIKGIIDHLDYISELGMTALWVNPLVENNNPQYSYHGYAITDFYKIDPRFGSNEDYLKLINECHERDLKVIMDMIFNHCSLYHWFIQDLPMENWVHQFKEFTRTNYRASIIPDQYSSEYDRNKMLSGWFDHHMPDFDQRNELLATYLIQNTIWWIEYAGIDGIRVDTQPYPYKEFISEWSRAIFNEYPNFNIVGEAWLQKEAITAYFQKDAANKDGYNSNIPCITDFPMYFALSSAFNENDSWTEGLASLYYVLAQDFLYADPQNNVIFCDNHDLDRFYSSVGEDLNKWKMGMAFLLTTRGIPMIYYGTEILMTGEANKGHGFIREDFPGGWQGDKKDAFITEGRTSEQNEAYNYLQKLLKWRKDKDVIHYGKLKHFVPEDEVYVYFRYDEDDCIMVAFNNSGHEMKALKTGIFKECMQDYNYAVNIISGEIINYLEALTLPPKSTLILELKK
ncbi:MAG: glycoside hydrolase family 13 protein [Bacteroidetes bacterium]|nr:glycoside hydrolase family 13 protein [Bacteroidota bacterium]MBL7103975.1 glycoside hydrolase family 13 protein [Bacteroidales bacterium]